jgi:hypothetical protein
MVIMFTVVIIVISVFCIGVVFYAVAFALMRRDLSYKQLTKFTTNHYYDYPLFKKNDAVFTDKCQQSLHR